MIGQTDNALLKKTEQAVEDKVPAQYQDAFKRIILAGQKIMYAPQMRQKLMNQLHSPGLSGPEAVGQGVTKLVGLALSQVQGGIKGPQLLPAIVAAATVLVCEAMDFVSKLGLIEVNNNTLGEATQAMGESLLQLIGVTPQNIQQAQAARGMAQQQPKGIIAGARGMQ